MRFEHALCVYPHRVDLGLRKQFYPPLGLEIIAAVLRPYCGKVEVIDLRRESKRTKDFLRPETGLVCFSVNWNTEREFVREEILSVPVHILTVLGGRHVTEDPEGWLSACPNVNILARGDGEETAKEIAEGRPLAEVAGISYRLDGRVVHNPVRRSSPVPEDFRPDRRLRRYVYRLDTPDFRTGLTFDSMASSLGCPFNCTFCSFNRNPWGGKRAWSARSPESVVRELGEIDAEVVGFVDDNFTHDMDRVGAICDLIQQRGIRKRYVVQARIELARRPDVLAKMERAGFAVLLLGIESAHDKTLRVLRKGFDRRQIREYFRVLRRSRMLLIGYFILGNFGENEAEMLAIAPFATELGLDGIVLSQLRSAPYSGLEELVARTPGYHVAPNGDIYSDDHSLSDLRRLRHRISRSFYAPGRIFKTLKKTLKSRMITPGMIARLPAFLAAKSLLYKRRTRAAARAQEASAALACPFR